MAFFSLIIPCYNIEKYLSHCLDSIYLQDFTDYEVILVNDGSTDKTLEIATKKANSKTLIFSQENSGVSEARNLGLSKASGTYVWFIDGDDYIRPGSLSLLYGYLKENEFDCFSFSYVMKTTGVPYPEQTFSPIAVPTAPLIGTSESILSSVPNCVARVVFRRSLADGLRFRKISYCEDWLFAMNIWFRSGKCGVSDAVLYYYYQRPGSAIYSMKPTVVGDFLKFSRYALAMNECRSSTAVRHYVEHSIRETIIPCIMVYIHDNVSDRKLKRNLFDDMCNSLLEFHREFAFPLDPHLRTVVTKRNWLIALFRLYWRYSPRRFLAKHPFFLKVYRKLRG